MPDLSSPDCDPHVSRITGKPPKRPRKVPDWRRVPSRERIPAIGESRRFPVTDVLSQVLFIVDGGVYTIRDAEEIIYIGHTVKRLPHRLAQHAKAGTAGLSSDCKTLTVTLQHGDADLEGKLIRQHMPCFNRQYPRRA